MTHNLIVTVLPVVVPDQFRVAEDEYGVKGIIKFSISQGAALGPPLQTYSHTHTLPRYLCSTRWDFTFVIAPLLQLLPRWSLSGLKMVTLHCTICWVRTTCKQTVCRDVSTQDTQTDPDTHTHTHGGEGLQRVVEDSFPENLHGSLLIFRLFGQHEMECLIFKFAHLNQAVSTIFFSPPPPLLGHATRAPTFRHVVVVAPRGFALPFAAPGEK